MARHKNSNVSMPDKFETYEQVNTAVLMDIRDELQHLNRMLTNCPAFQGMPRVVARIDRRLAESMKLKPGRNKG